MKILMFMYLLLFGFPARDKGPDSLVSCHFNKVPFPEFCDYIHHESGVNIYYRDTWVKGITVTMDANKIRVIAAVEMALKGSGLEVSIWNDDLVIMPGE